jgi:hypothetical protein
MRSVVTTGSNNKRLRRLLAPLRLVEQARGWRRYGLVAAYAVVVALVGMVAWRHVCLVGLPDVGDPFDRAQFRAELKQGSLDDAVPLYEKAGDRLRPCYAKTVHGTLPWKDGGLIFQESPISDGAFARGWAKAEPEVRAWAQANRDVSEIWIQATQLPQACLPRDGDVGAWPNSLRGHVYYNLFMLSLMEAARLEEAGDWAGAWRWYRASLRSIRQIGNLHPFRMRFHLERTYHPLVTRRLDRWAADPRADAELLRRALDDTLAVDALPESDKLALKAEYLALMESFESASWYALEDSRDFEQLLDGVGRSTQLFDPGDLHQLAQGLAKARAFALNEPERSRRITRLVFANWLEHIDDFAEGNSGFAPFQVSSLPYPVVLTGEMPRDSVRVRGISVASLSAWYESSDFVKHRLPDLLVYQRGNFLRSSNQGTLVVRLAAELYAREHDGVKPPSAQSLVGPYLRALPDSYVEQFANVNMFN